MNPFDTLYRHIGQTTSYTKEEADTICSSFVEEHFRRDEPLFRSGERYLKTIFVAEGILRSFVVDDAGEEIVKNFIEENEFFADMDCLEKNMPSVLNLSTVTDCTILTLSPSAAAMLKQTIPGFENNFRMTALLSITAMIAKQNFLRIGDSQDQYRHFVRQFPNLAMNVPLKYIASYLRITQSSLSRIRRQDW